MSQTDRDCGGTQTHGQTDRPARLLLPPQLRQETSLGSESARHVQPDLTGRTPAAFRGCGTDGLSCKPQKKQTKKKQGILSLSFRGHT